MPSPLGIVQDKNVACTVYAEPASDTVLARIACTLVHDGVNTTAVNETKLLEWIG